MNIDPLESKKRIERYWYADGLWEISFGIILALLSGFYFLVIWLEGTQIPAFTFMILQIAVVIGIFFIVNHLLRFLKERITYPRSGYVVFRKPAPMKRIQRVVVMMLFSMLLAVGLGLLSIVQPVASRMALVISLILAGVLVYVGFRFNLVRMFVIAALTVLLGLGISLLGLPDPLSNAYFFCGFSLLFFISGGATLWKFLRSTQPASADLDYEAPQEGENGPQA